jgi:hypothetical protein
MGGWLEHLVPSLAELKHTVTSVVSKQVACAHACMHARRQTGRSCTTYGIVRLALL